MKTRLIIIRLSGDWSVTPQEKQSLRDKSNNGRPGDWSNGTLESEHLCRSRKDYVYSGKLKPAFLAINIPTSSDLPPADD